jgi:hypothetical protein
LIVLFLLETTASLLVALFPVNSFLKKLIPKAAVIHDIYTSTL